MSMLNILLAEDSAADIRLVREALSEHDVQCRLHIGRDGAEAIRLIEELDSDPAKPPLHLAFVDLHLPKRDGEEILTALRATRFTATPVIVMTASDAAEDRATAEKHSARYFFRKPSTLDEFLQLGMIARKIVTEPAPASDRGDAELERGAL